MRFDTRLSDDVFVVSLPYARFDAAVAAAALEELARLIESRPRIVVDLSSVGYMDLMGLEALLEAIRRCRGKVVLAALSTPIRSLFTIALPPGCLAIEESVPAALDRFRAWTLANSAGI